MYHPISIGNAGLSLISDWLTDEVHVVLLHVEEVNANPDDNSHYDDGDRNTDSKTDLGGTGQTRFHLLAFGLAFLIKLRCNGITLDIDQTFADGVLGRYQVERRALTSCLDLHNHALGLERLAR